LAMKVDFGAKTLSQFDCSIAVVRDRQLMADKSLRR